MRRVEVRDGPPRPWRCGLWDLWCLSSSGVGMSLKTNDSWVRRR